MIIKLTIEFELTVFSSLPSNISHSYKYNCEVSCMFVGGRVWQALFKIIIIFLPNYGR